MLIPADVDNKQFATTRLKEGYDQEEVDEFLDRIVADWRADRDELERVRGELKKILTANAAADTQMISPVMNVERILVAAQRTAEEVESEANVEAGKIRAEAHTEADGIRNAARSEARQVLDELEARRSKLSDQISELESRKATYRNWLRTMLTKMEEDHG